jgi:hypothetical protein
VLHVRSGALCSGLRQAFFSRAIIPIGMSDREELIRTASTALDVGDIGPLKVSFDSGGEVDRDPSAR